MTSVELVTAVRRFLPWPFSGTKIVCLEPSIEEQHELQMLQLHQLSCDIKDYYLMKSLRIPLPSNNVITSN